MSHGRKDIRDAVKSILIAAEIVPEGNVFANRAIRIQDSESPIINIMTSDETSSVAEQCPGKLKRRLTVLIQLAAVPGTTEENDPIPVDDVMDDFADQIELALDDDFQWNGTVTESHLVQTTVSQSAEGSKMIGFLTLSYEALYFF